MKIFVKHQNGPSPRIILSGSVADLRELSSQLSCGAAKLETEGKAEGTIPLVNAFAAGDTIEWIAFHAVRDIDSLVRNNDRVSKRRMVLLPIVAVLVLLMLYLAFKGTLSILK